MVEIEYQNHFATSSLGRPSFTPFSPMPHIQPCGVASSVDDWPLAMTFCHKCVTIISVAPA